MCGEWIVYKRQADGVFIGNDLASFGLADPDFQQLVPMVHVLEQPGAPMVTNLYIVPREPHNEEGSPHQSWRCSFCIPFWHYVSDFIAQVCNGSRWFARGCVRLCEFAQVDLLLPCNNCEALNRRFVVRVV